MNKTPKEDIERVARALCKLDGDDPNRLEPGDLPVTDGIARNGDPCHYLWRHYTKPAKIAREASHLPEQLADADEQLKAMAIDSIEDNKKLAKAEERIERAILTTHTRCEIYIGSNRYQRMREKHEMLMGIIRDELQQGETK